MGLTIQGVSYVEFLRRQRDEEDIEPSEEDFARWGGSELYMMIDEAYDPADLQSRLAAAADQGDDLMFERVAVDQHEVE